MKRNILKIDETKCNGCGLCAGACAEGAIAIVDGKARLVSETYCDGLGACLGECPMGAITIEERDAPAFDLAAAEAHVKAAKAKAESASPRPHAEHNPGQCCPTATKAHGHACPGSALRTFARPAAKQDAREDKGPAIDSELTQWPVQLMLVPPTAPFLRGADLLICADCVPFAFADFHGKYLAGRAVLVGCPKLDDVEFYAEKLAEVFAEATPKSVTVVRMQVPCCGGIVQAALRAREAAAAKIAINVDTISLEGGVLRQETL